ncbi:ankyrin repeat domain-containing protein 52 [Coprinopsis cinerea okayama7|uniref:Ankyrin repeat domain-containing protein 52 n=1 Tax=Coprinopsis cinerea (strain Okayama-7 / 130 / ATCC MYA-4618 / FGSC 9003) TaxID=240176 RepID=A8NAI6_COPC7|nr:ankyrin repeat domain-containing protein 52 [Coprinopsis cinerea okayama7\|eukprot:XP_001831838.1 ankyrin repeat domain-containing protein 52 [Coprinopsis cinerea okayama7\
MGQGVSFQNEPEADRSTPSDARSPSLDTGRSLSHRGSFPNEPSGDPSTLPEEQIPSLNEGVQLSSGVQDMGAGQARASGSSDSAVADYFKDNCFIEDPSSSATSDIMLREPKEEVARGEDNDTPVINWTPRAVYYPAVHISDGARVTGNPVIAGGDVNIFNIYNNAADVANGQSADGKFERLRGEIQDWFAQSANFHVVQQQNYEKWTDGTLSWFTESEDYLTWKDGRRRILWGTGIPGAGKTILAAKTIHDLQILQEASPKKICVVFAYCRYSERLNVKDILESLVTQFLEAEPSLADLVEPLYSLHQRKKTRPTQQELLDLLRQFEGRFDIVFYVIDGLDEALVDTQFDLIKVINFLQGQFALTSRPLKKLEAGLPTTRFYSVTAKTSDIVLLIVQMVERNPGFRTLLEQHSYLHELVRQISDKSKGMFLHAALQIEFVQHCLSIADLEQALDSLPTDLHDIYSQALKRINDQPKRNANLAKHVLLWLVFGREALSFPDLQHALGLTLPDYRDGVDKEALASICCGLVTVEAETDLVRLVHFTAQDALVPILKEYIPDPHGVLFSVSAQRLVDCGIISNSVGAKTREDLSQALKGHPLLKYCYDHWSHHARECMANPVLRDAVLDFVRRCKSFPDMDPDGWNLTFLTPLHIVARHGLHLILDEALMNIAGGKVTLRTRGRRKATPLMLASEHGHVEVIDALLRYTRRSMLRSTLSGEGRPGSHLFLGQLNLRDSRGMTALMFASREGHADAVRRLLAHKDTQVNLTDESGRTALMHASENGHEGPVQHLLDHKDIQVNLAGRNGYTALMFASCYGHEAIVQRLLACKATQANLANDDGQTALMLGSSNGRGEAVHHLLAHQHIQVNLADNDGWAALMLASAQGYKVTVQPLLAHKDTQVNLVNKVGRTALMLASCNDHQGPVRHLLAHEDTQVMLADNNGYTALMLASRYGHDTIVQLLLAHKQIQVNLADNEGRTALMIALSPGSGHITSLDPWSLFDKERRLRLIALLVGCHDLDANAVDEDGDTALILAARGGRSEAVSLLLQRTRINIHHRNKMGESALTVAWEGLAEVDSGARGWGYSEWEHSEEDPGTEEDYKAIIQILTEFERRSS